MIMIWEVKDTLAPEAVSTSKGNVRMDSSFEQSKSEGGIPLEPRNIKHPGNIG